MWSPHGVHIESMGESKVLLKATTQDALEKAYKAVKEIENVGSENMGSDNMDVS
jgi:hypothetical protein